MDTVNVTAVVGACTRERARYAKQLAETSGRAALRLRSGAPQAPAPTAAYSADQDRPGWVFLLNGEFEPHITDFRVSAFRYENFRPFHPERLQLLLDERVELGEFGALVRSAGFCRLATRSDIVAQWEQAGHMLSFTPLDRDDHDSEDAELARTRPGRRVHRPGPRPRRSDHRARRCHAHR